MEGWRPGPSGCGDGALGAQGRVLRDQARRRRRFDWAEWLREKHPAQDPVGYYRAYGGTRGGPGPSGQPPGGRSEEHTSELQSRRDLVCRLLLEKKKEARG